MSLLNNPEFKAKYDKCKKIIKVWETKFKAKNGRIPSKLDIREADQLVRNAYKRYFQLKTEALKHSLEDITEETQLFFDNSTLNIDDSINEQSSETFNDSVTNDVFEHNENAWGSHLVKPKETPKQIDEKKSKLTRKLSEKIFTGSKFAKKNPRKSFINKSKSLDLSSISQISETSSQPFGNKSEYNVISENIENDSILIDDKIKIINEKETLNSTKPINFLQIAENANLKPVKNLNREWLNRVNQQNNIEPDNFECNAEPISPSETVPVYGLSNFQSLNLSKITESKHDTTTEEFANRLSPEKSTDNIITEISTNVPEIENISSENDDIVANSDPENEIIKRVSHIKKKRRILTASTRNNISIIPQKKTELTKKTVKHIEKHEVKPRKTYTRKVKTVAISQTNEIVNNLMSDDIADPYAADSDGDPDFELKSGEKNKSYLEDAVKFESNDSIPLTSVKKIKKVRSVHKSPKEPKSMKSKEPKHPNRGRKRKKDDITEEDAEEKSDSELGPINIKEMYRCKIPEIVPRFQSLKKVKVTKSTSPKIEADESETFSKISKENFIRLNLRKKVFVRGKKTMTFAKYQKNKWKAKKKALALAGPDMDMGGCDGGQLKCFTCGGIGHFSRQCKALKGEQLLPLEADEGEVCPFPTLEEAYQNATQSKLSIHVTRTQNHFDEENLENSEVNNYDNVFDDEPIDMTKIDELISLVELSSNETQNLAHETSENDNPFIIKPLYNRLSNGSLIETPDEVYAALNQFGFATFRQGQEKAIMRILSGLSTLVTLSTGSGKSLCYQLPAYLYSKYRSPSIALVISPLISLMDDQVAQSERTACLHAGMSKVSRKKTLDSLKSGCYDSLLISPEAIVGNLDSLIRRLPPISFACIDEVHCVSQWSYNFRPSYLTICRVLRERLGVKILLGLTATAPLTTQQSILSHLGIPENDTESVVGATPIPENLTLTVSKDGRRDAALVAILKSERLKDYKSIIVYCTRRNDCERLAGILRTCFQDEVTTIKKKRKGISYSVEAYHAGLSQSRRRTIQNAFMKGDLKIVIATVAFGMGINKSDIRAVIHYNMPRSFESYVQEVGRAGRDGLPAHCHLFLDSHGNDQCELQRHIFSDSLDRHVIRKLLEKVFIPCECKSRGIVCPKHEVAFSIEDTVRLMDVPEENIATLLCYLELHERSFVQVLSSTYTWCKVVSYGGPKAINEAAQNCAPLAMAIAMEVKKGTKFENLNTIEFPVVEVASAIGWESGMVKHYLKNLEWATVNGQPKRSTISVELSNLGFRVRAAGDLSSNDLDMALDYLHNRVQQQEKTALIQLQKCFDAFSSVATNSFMISDEEAIEHSDKMKQIIFNYFQSKDFTDENYILRLGEVNESHISQDVRSIISMYPDNNFTSRAIARIFHGIQSPNYPAVIWGRCKYWRAHLKSDFNAICKIATQEIIRMR